MTITEGPCHFYAVKDGSPEMPTKIRTICHFEFSERTYTEKVNMKFHFDNRLACMTTTETTGHELATKLCRISHFEFSKWTYT